MNSRNPARNLSSSLSPLQVTNLSSSLPASTGSAVALTVIRFPSSMRLVTQWILAAETASSNCMLRASTKFCPSSVVKGMNPAPHIHEQMATANYVQMATTLRTPSRITTSYASSHPCMRTCVLFLVCPLPCVRCFLPRLTVLLPALPDVHLSAQREVQVQPPVRLPLGDRGHIRLRDTPHRL